MKLSTLDPQAVRRRLLGDGLRLDLNPFTASLHSDVPGLADELALLYADFPLVGDDAFIDFHVEIRRERRWGPWLRYEARFLFDGQPAFVTLPERHAVAMVEWGLNWAIAVHAHRHLVCHAAVLERDGRAVLLPAPPGSGKSTLCAALAHRGWRLLSDELALIDPATGAVTGMARPINLKNASIPLLAEFEPAAVMTQPIPDTTKGTVALVKPPADAVRRRLEPATPAWIVLPRWIAGESARFEPVDRAEAAILLAEQSFNYHVLGLQGFETVVRLVERCRCLRLRYGELGQLEAAFDALAAGSPPGVQA